MPKHDKNHDKKHGKNHDKNQNKKSKNILRKKRNHDDDSSVDSRGNLRGFIDYDYTDSDSTYTESDSYDSSSETNDSPIAHRLRSRTKHQQPKKLKRRSSYTSSSDDDIAEKIGMILKLQEEKKRLQKLLHKKERHVQESSDDMEDDTEEEAIVPLKKRGFKVGKYRKGVIESSSEEEEEEDNEDEDEEMNDGTVDEDNDVNDDDEEEDNNEEDEEDDDYDDEDGEEEPRGIMLSFGLGDENDRLVPKRHNMKKESAEVKKFVKLITTPSDEDTIDGQIDQFKALPEDQRNKLINVLESRTKNPAANPQQSLMFKILTMNLPTEVQSMVLNKYNSLQMLDPGTSEYFKMRNWLEKVTSMPLGIYKEIPVKLSDGSETCASFMEKARGYLNEAIYGQEETKLQILQFIGTKIANPDSRGLSLLLAGPPGVGKTSIIKNGIAKALNWPFQFISLGGDSDASTYTGHQLVYESSHCGKIVNSLCAAKSMSMVLMFDELDKISATPKGEEVQNLLVHLTDPVQNGEFEDKYLAGIPIDLSKVMFTFSANYLERIDKVLLDRMTVVQLQGYSQKEKVTIAESFLLPAALKEVGLGEKVGLSKDVVQYIIENYANEESGVRELKRCMEQIAQKINMLRMFNNKDLPFYIKDFSLPFVVKKDHIDLFLKKKPVNQSTLSMYT